MIEENIENFYVDNQGSFDRLVYSVLVDFHDAYPDIDYNIILAYMPKEYDDYLKDKNTLYPDGVECVPKHFAIL